MVLHHARAILPLLLLAATAGPAGAASRVGVAAAVQNQVSVQGGGTRALANGAAVFQDETVRTGDASSAQLLFLDETSLTVGPRSEVKLDRFVFDPARGTGQVVLQTGRGAFRFITGSQDPKNYTLRTPTATIGVRGTIGDLFNTANFTLLINVEGRLFATIGGKTFTLDTPGQALMILPNGQVQLLSNYQDIIKVVGTLPFPLFGSNFLAEIRRIEGADTGRDVTDQLKALGVDTVGPPPPPINRAGQDIR